MCGALNFYTKKKQQINGHDSVIRSNIIYFFFDSLFNSRQQYSNSAFVFLYFLFTIKYTIILLVECNMALYALKILLFIVSNEEEEEEVDRSERTNEKFLQATKLPH